MCSLRKGARVACALSCFVLAAVPAVAQEGSPEPAPPAEPPPAPPAEPPPAPAEPPSAEPPPAEPPPAEPPPAAPPAEPPPAEPPPPLPPSPPPSAALPPVPPPAPAPAPKPAPAPAAKPTPAPLAPAPAPAPKPTPAPPAAPKPPPAQKPPPQQAAPADDQKDDKKESRVFRIGPLLGVGAPSVFSIGGTLKLTDYIGGGLTFGIIPTLRLTYYGEAVLSYQHLDFYGRLYPFGGGFFIGAGAGYATIEGTVKKTVDISAYTQQVPNSGLPNSVDYESRGSVRTLVLSPVIGYLHTFDSGFSLGVDAGMQLPIAPSEVEFDSEVSSTVPPAVAEQFLAPTDQAVQDTLETIGRTPVPTFNLRIGWLL